MANKRAAALQIDSITERRFNAYVVWARNVAISPLITEVEWLEIKPARVFATVFLDHTDQDLNGAVLAPDLAGKYRAVETLQSHSSIPDVVNATAECMARVARDYDRSRNQGDEKPTVDFFAEVAKESKLHTNFKYLRDNIGAIAGRRLIEIAMRWYENQDGSYVEQFQTTGFDPRLWELYLWAVLREARFHVEQPNPSPDFLARGLVGDFYIEATTANPPPSDKVVPLPRTEAAIFEYVHSYLPTRFSGPLTAKLEKRYWEGDGTLDIPFVVAVQDFHHELSMTWSQSALFEYLYGVRIEEGESGGKMHKVEVPATELKWGDKELTSGFFKLPDSEHISAVIFNAAGTLAKFNRMGIAAGLGDPSVAATHEGRRFSKDNSGVEEGFSHLVTEDCNENWVDGLTVFHNPNALRPLPFDALRGAAHVFDENGLHRQFAPAGHLVSSTTKIVVKSSSAPKTVTSVK